MPAYDAIGKSTEYFITRQRHVQLLAWTAGVAFALLVALSTALLVALTQ